MAAHITAIAPKRKLAGRSCGAFRANAPSILRASFLCSSTRVSRYLQVGWLRYCMIVLLARLYAENRCSPEPDESVNFCASWQQYAWAGSVPWIAEPLHGCTPESAACRDLLHVSTAVRQWLNCRIVVVFNRCKLFCSRALTRAHLSLIISMSSRLSGCVSQ